MQITKKGGDLVNKKTRALSYEQYLKIIETILAGFVCAKSIIRM